MSAILILALAPIAQARVKDAWITAKTKIDLMTTDGVRTSDLNVDTVNGVVTLHGHAPTAMQSSSNCMPWSRRIPSRACAALPRLK